MQKAVARTAENAATSPRTHGASGLADAEQSNDRGGRPTISSHTGACNVSSRTQKVVVRFLCIKG